MILNHIEWIIKVLIIYKMPLPEIVQETVISEMPSYSYVMKVVLERFIKNRSVYKEHECI